MEIRLYDIAGLSKIWHFQTVHGPFTLAELNARQVTWAIYVSKAEEDARKRFSKYQLAIQVRSRLRSSDIPDDEFNEWNKIVTKRLRDKTPIPCE